jgi:hypothetical protein
VPLTSAEARGAPPVRPIHRAAPTPGRRLRRPRRNLWMKSALWITGFEGDSGTHDTSEVKFNAAIAQQATRDYFVEHLS